MTWFTGRSLRARVLMLGSLLTAALVAVGVAVPVPYVALGPGVTYDTLGEVDGTEVITFSGDDVPASTSETFGSGSHLNMTTISVADRLPLFAALGLWAEGDYALVPREDQFPPDKTVEEVNEQNAQLFAESQSAAEIAALRSLKYPNVVYAGTIADGSPSDGVLQTQDRITAVDGTEVTDRASLLAALADTKPGQKIAVTVLRDESGKETGKKVAVTLGAWTKDLDPDGTRKNGYVGIAPVERPLAPFTISISLSRIGGPSAGLMFTLGIIDKLTPGDLTSGHFIAGTGEIQPDPDDASKPSVVGPIGGIQLKLIAARDKGATVFLVPAPNCQEAVARIPEGLQLVKVATLDDATSALQDIAEGRTPPGC